MKKRILSVIGATSFLGVALTATVNAAEPGAYKMTDDGGSYSIEILNETNLKIDATAASGETFSFETVYENIDEDTIKILSGNGKYMIVDLKSDGTFNDVDEPTANEAEAYITINLATGGNVMTDIEEGKIGDIVTLYVSANPFYMVKSVMVNGVLVAPNEAGVCQFTLKEGENIVSAEFVLNNEELRQILEVLNNAKEFGIDSLFTVDNLLMLIQWVFALLMGSGWFVTMLRMKKIKNKTTAEVATEFSEVLKKVNAEEVNRFLKEVMGLTIDGLTEDVTELKTIMLSLCKCMILAQENTPEARLSIITELTNLKNNDQDLAEQIRAIIKKEQASNERAIQERDAAISALKEENKKLSSTSSKETTEVDDYGTI